MTKKDLQPLKLILSDGNGIIKGIITFISFIMGIAILALTIHFNIILKDIIVFFDSLFAFALGVGFLVYGYRYSQNHKPNYVKLDEQGIQ